MTLGMINLIVILAVLAAFVFLLKTLLGNKNKVLGSKSKHIKVVDNGLSVSVGQRLSIVKVGNEYFLMTHGQNGVAFQKLEAQDFEENEKKWEEEFKAQTSFFSPESLANRFGKKKGEKDEK